jgi:hypothetical protein
MAPEPVRRGGICRSASLTLSRLVLGQLLDAFREVSAHLIAQGLPLGSRNNYFVKYRRIIPFYIRPDGQYPVLTNLKRQSISLEFDLYY